MNISYQKFSSEPPQGIAEEITMLHRQIFGGLAIGSKSSLARTRLNLCGFSRQMRRRL